MGAARGSSAERGGYRVGGNPALGTDEPVPRGPNRAAPSSLTLVQVGSVQFYLRDANGVVWLTEVQSAYRPDMPHHLYV